MGRVWSMVAGGALCLACAGKAQNHDAEASTGGSENRASSGGTATASGGQGESSSGGSASPPPPACPCQEAALFCDYADDSCGRTSPDGVCAPRHVCQDDDGPLCGCDGVVYPSSCAAFAAGVDLDNDGQCQLAGSYFCGARACPLNTGACSALLNHADGSVRSNCVPISEECRAAVVSGDDRFCECVEPGRCTCRYQDDADGTAIFKLCSDR